MCESILNCFFSSCARLQLLTWKLPNEDNARFCLDSVVQHSLVFTCLSFERLHRFLFCSKQKHGCRSRLRRFHVQRSYNRRSDVVFHRCSGECRCISFNIRTTNNTLNCQLNDENRNTKPQALVATPELHYYDLVIDYPTEVKFFFLFSIRIVSVFSWPRLYWRFPR